MHSSEMGRCRSHTRIDMAIELETLEFPDRGRWRAWLARHHASSPGVWLVFYKKHSARKSIPYEDSIREALCFGWVDSLVKRLDEDRYKLKFTPRKPTSKWSDPNRKRWKELEKAGLLAPPGIASPPTESRYAPRPKVPVLPGYIATALESNQRAWSFFRKLSPTDRRDYVVWIHLAQRPETRAKRIRESIALLKAGQKLGLR
jgi:uncharacterized protein YdeI (YjbR/CyaY-like superfamily)